LLRDLGEVAISDETFACVVEDRKGVGRDANGMLMFWRSENDRDRCGSGGLGVDNRESWVTEDGDDEPNCADGRESTWLGRGEADVEERPAIFERFPFDNDLRWFPKIPRDRQIVTTFLPEDHTDIHCICLTIPNQPIAGRNFQLSFLTRVYGIIYFECSNVYYFIEQTMALPKAKKKLRHPRYTGSQRTGSLKRPHDVLANKSMTSIVDQFSLAPFPTGCDWRIVF